MTKTIAIVYHSGFGHTAKVAKAVEDGVKVGGATATLYAIDENGALPDSEWTALDKADGIIFGTPTYMGGPSWQFKKVADASAKRWFGQVWKNKIAAGFTNSGASNGDKLATLQQLSTLALQHGMIWVGLDQMPPMPKGTDTPAITDINRLGSFSGLMTQSNNESAEVVPPSGDLETAKLFGKRVATIAKAFTL